ncbi:hypothetical protein LCGC14_1085300 [marine sediment metagenome]|uniref:LamG-like jellyroll fold domain-containing protein n=1 Tax=marine sediment metagenome TaxID=412755 RepID=A0A0F9ME61_9ZZZZ
MANGDMYHVAGNLSPARAAVKLIATADEALLIDAWAVARVAAGDTEGTITAWINIPDITGDYGIVSAGDTAAVEFITLSVKAGKIRIGINDATALKCDHSTTDVVITAHRWHHIAVTQDATLHAPRIYVDGKLKDLTATDESDNGTWFVDLALIDDASIGAAEEAGAAGQTKEMKGAISDVKYWDVALTESQVDNDYDGKAPDDITGTSGDLTNWWDMKDDYIDSVAGENGTAGASLKLTNAYSEFSSRMAFMTGSPVVADDISISVSVGVGHAVIIKAA